MNTKMDYDSSKVVSESGLEGRLEITSTPGLTHGKPYKASMKTALEAELPIRENVHPQGMNLNCTSSGRDVTSLDQWFRDEQSLLTSP
jgi:hypothetical protein